MSVIVFGSLNTDLVTVVPRLPVAGETLTGRNFFTAAGGKGANQAVAAARLGVPTRLVGRVGNDAFGAELISGLRQSGVRTEGIVPDESTHSGVASITVDEAGENTIAIVAGANGRVDESDVERLRQWLSGATALLLQLEVPMNAVVAAARAAQQEGIPVILDPAPTPELLPEKLYELVDTLTPNQVEASQLVGFPVTDRDSATKAAKQLRDRGVGRAIVKLGAKGVVCVTATDTMFVPAFAVDAVDTVAAGDAFNGALAAALAHQLPLRQALVWGAAAGALSVTKSGAQPSLPERSAFEAFLQERERG